VTAEILDISDQDLETLAAFGIVEPGEGEEMMI
jgi:hypothetical protein